MEGYTIRKEFIFELQMNDYIMSVSTVNWETCFVSHHIKMKQGSLRDCNPLLSTQIHFAIHSNVALRREYIPREFQY